MKKARHLIGGGLLIPVGFGGAVSTSSVRLAADEGDGADIATGVAGVLLAGGASGGTGGGTAGFLLLDSLLVADDTEGGEDDGGEDQAADEGGAEGDGIALEGTAGADGEECVGCGDDCGDVLLHWLAPFPWCGLSDELNIQLRPSERIENGQMRKQATDMDKMYSTVLALSAPRVG